MKNEKLMAEWRKQRNAAVSSSEIGLRPLHENGCSDSEAYQLSSEPALYAEQPVVCCKHGVKCHEYYEQNQKSEKKISSLWPICELFSQNNQAINLVKSIPPSPTINSKFKQKYTISSNQNRQPTEQYNNHRSTDQYRHLSSSDRYSQSSDQYNHQFSDQYSRRSNDQYRHKPNNDRYSRSNVEYRHRSSDQDSQPSDQYSESSKQSNPQMFNHYDNFPLNDTDKNLLKKLVKSSMIKSDETEIIAENTSKLNFLHRYYLGQRPRSASRTLAPIPQNFSLYHELPEDIGNVDTLQPYAPLWIVFVNNNLEYRYLPIQECFIHGKRRLFVNCGDKDIKSFKKLEYLVRYYAKMFAYTDSQGRRSRFPDNPVDEPIQKLIE